MAPVAPRRGTLWLGSLAARAAARGNFEPVSAWPNTSQTRKRCPQADANPSPVCLHRCMSPNVTIFDACRGAWAASAVRARRARITPLGTPNVPACHCPSKGDQTAKPGACDSQGDQMPKIHRPSSSANALKSGARKPAVSGGAAPRQRVPDGDDRARRRTNRRRARRPSRAWPPPVPIALPSRLPRSSTAADRWVAAGRRAVQAAIFTASRLCRRCCPQGSRRRCLRAARSFSDRCRRQTHALGA